MTDKAKLEDAALLKQPQTLQTEVLIVGGGPAGLAAALTCERMHVNYLLLERGELGGQLHWVHNRIEDYIGLPVGLSTSFSAMDGPSFLQMLVPHSSAVHSHCLTGWEATGIDVPNQTVKVACGSDSQSTAFIRYRSLIVATGARERKLGIPGEELPEVHGARYSTSLHAREFAGRDIVMVGGGDRALESSVRCADAGARVRIVHRSSTFRAKPAFQEQVRRQGTIQVEWGTVVERIGRMNRGTSPKDAATGGESALRLSLCETDSGRRWNVICDAVIVRIGVELQTEWLRETVACAPDRSIAVDRFGRTSVPSIFAVGDVCIPNWAARLQTAVSQGSLAVQAALHDHTVSHPSS